MSESDPASSLQLQEYARRSQQILWIAERVERWRRGYDGLKSPEEALEDEKRRLKKGLRKARTIANSYVRHDELARHHEAIDDIISYTDQLRALEPGCECKAKERREIYGRQINECIQGFPARGVRLPEDTDPSSAPSPTPGTESQLDERVRTSRPFDDAGEDSTSIPVSQPPNALFSQAIAGRDQDQASFFRLDYRVSEVENASGAVFGFSATQAPFSTGGDQEANNKRKATESSLICNSQLPSKRLRPNENETETTTTTTANDDDQGNPDFEQESEAESGAGSDPEADSEAEANLPPEEGQAEVPRFASQFNIDFDELYQGGGARFKHHIVLHDDGKFYILRCDTCPLHFNDNPLLGAARHLDSNRHNHMCRRRALAVRVLGIEVLNCNDQKQKTNNDAFDKAIANGYRPHHRIQGGRRRKQVQQQEVTTTSSRGRNQRTMEKAVLDPIPGEIYLASWKGSDQVGVIVLPRGCFGDPSFADVGLNGSSLAEDTSLLDNLDDIPECYRTCPQPKKITGWAAGYEDGGEKVHERKYPVMYFDGIEGFRKMSVKWLSVRHLLEYDRESFLGNRGLIANYTHLRQFEEEREKTRKEAGPEERNAAVQDHRPVTTALELPDYSPPLPAAHSTDTIGPPTEMMVPNGIAAPPPGPEGPSTDAPDEHRNAEGGSTAPYMAPAGMLTNPPLHNRFPTSAAIRPTQENVIGHATTRGEGVQFHQHATLSSSGSQDGLAEPATEGVQSAASTILYHNHGQNDRLGSENPALTSKFILSGVHTPVTAKTRLPAGGAAPLPDLFPRPTAGAAGVDPEGPKPWSTTKHSPVMQGPANRQGGHPEGLGPGGTTGNPAARQSPVSEQAGPSVRVSPILPPQIPTSEPPPYPHGIGGTPDAPIVIDDAEQPPATAPLRLAKRTQNAFSPPRRSFDQKPAVTRDATFGPQCQPSAAQPSAQASSQHEPAEFPIARQPAPAPEPVMDSCFDESTMDFDVFIDED